MSSVCELTEMAWDMRRAATPAEEPKSLGAYAAVTIRRRLLLDSLEIKTPCPVYPGLSRKV